jgi:hypothetical protein
MQHGFPPCWDVHANSVLACKDKPVTFLVGFAVINVEVWAK